MTSQTAKSLNGTSVFYLRDHVKIQQLNTTQHLATTLLTQFLTLYPKQNVAITDAPVTIEQPGLKINAKGLRADLNSGNIELLSNARGHYDPHAAR